MDAKKLALEPNLREFATLDAGQQNNSNQLTGDFDSLCLWLERMIANLAEKCPDSETHHIQACELRELFLRIKAAWKELILRPSQTKWLVHLLELTLWTFQLSICATLAGAREENQPHSKIFIEISNHLFTNYILLRDNLLSLWISGFDVFNEHYANMFVYSIIRNFVSFYGTYCLWFEDITYSKELKLNTEWEKVRKFIRISSNKSRHDYNKKSNQLVSLKNFDPFLEIDYEENPEFHPKIGCKVHKYPLMILVMFRFLLRDQGDDFEVINNKWFSCNKKIFDRLGNVKQINV